ncbi:MAG: sensor histidine kinase [Spirochaetota bacterium]
MNQETDSATILAVDDQPANLEVVSRFLGQAGYRVLIAKDGERAIERAQRARPDLILMDVRLPGEDGFAVCRRLKRIPELCRTPVIFMTAFSDDQSKQSAFDAGGVDYVAKPVSPGELLARVSTHIEIARYRYDLEQEIERRTEDLRRRTEEQSLLLDTMSAQVWYLTDEKTYGPVNRARAEFIGKSADDLVGRPMREFLPEEVARECERSNAQAFASDAPVHTEEWGTNARGERRLLSITKSPGPRTGRRAAYVVCVGVDLTEQHELEERLRRELNEKELLIREVHHRVKNNLSVVASLLQLQLNAIDSGADPAQALRSSSDRIHAMARIHQQLHESGKLSELPMDEYVRNLAVGLASIYDPEHRITILTETDDITMDVTMGIPCGILINELVTNSLKHAFPGRDHGEIRIILDHGDKAACRLQVIDDGVGTTLDPADRAGGSLGATLVHALCEQIGGTLTVEGDHGTCVTVEVPLERSPGS